MSALVDLTGQTFGRLTVIERAPNSKQGETRWRCRCECGAETVVASYHLRRPRGSTRSCGCLQHEVQQARIRNLTGQVFGRLTVLRDTGTRRHRCVVWECQCSCGQLTQVVSVDLTQGHTQSCGCLHREHISQLGRQALTHGATGSAEHQAYLGARRRCNNPKSDSWPHYGGRGIEFRFTSFEEFFAEVGPRPEGVHESGRAIYSLDRIDVDGHYEPGNVRWADDETQAANKRGNKIPFSGTADEAQRVADYLSAYEARRDAA